MNDDGALRRRLERERRARLEAEAIAERVTSELYGSHQQLQRANNELQAVNQSLREFVAVASHDLRGPLTSILGLASTLTQLGDRVPPEKQTRFLGIIERQAQHLEHMIEELLTVSRIEAGALETHAEVVKLAESVSRVVEDFGHRARGVRVEVNEARALVDPDHLQRILFNYVGNALKYGAPPISVEARHAGEWVEVVVRDSGRGVPDEFRPRLFDKFARGETSGEVEGTGLGLSIVRGLARANGGDTWYEQNRPRGACFGVRLRHPAA